MMKKFARDIQHYTPLFAILAAGFIGFTTFSYDKNFQVVILLATVAGYTSWGLVHHYIHRDLQLEVILEYIAYGIIGSAVVLSLLISG